MIFYHSFLFAQSNDILAAIRTDSLFLYNAKEMTSSFVLALPPNNEWRFYKTRYDGTLTTMWLYGNIGEMTVSLSQSQLVDLSIDTVPKLIDHNMIGKYYTRSGSIWQSLDDKDTIFMYSRHYGRQKKNRNLNCFRTKDTIEILGRTLPRCGKEEYNVCDLSDDSTKLLVMYSIEFCKSYRFLPIICEIDIKTKSISKVNVPPGFNIKYSPSQRFFLYWKQGILIDVGQIGYYLYDSLSNQEWFLNDVSDAAWLNRNNDIINSEKIQYYMY